MKKTSLWMLCLALVIALSIAPLSCVTAESAEAIDVSITTVDFGKSPDGTPIQEEWEKMMQEKLGKTINFTWYRYGMADYPEKIKTVVSSGQITDITTYFNNSSDAITYGEKGMFVDLSKYTDLTPNYNAVLASDADSKSKVYSNDSVYAFYYATYVNETYYDLWNYTGTMYKGSAFEAAGLEYPSTLDGIYEAAKTLKETGASEYPIVLLEEWQYPDDVVMAAYHTSTNRFWNGEKYEYGPLSEDYRDALKWLNKIYTEGLISPDYFTHTTENGSAAIANGTACIVLSCWEGYSAEYGKADKYPDDKWVMGTIPASDKYPDDTWAFNTVYTPGWTVYSHNSFVISAKSDNIEDLIKLGDLQYESDVVSLLNWGRADIDYIVDENGVKQRNYDMQDADSVAAYVATGNPNSGTCRAAIFPQTCDIEYNMSGNVDGPFVYNGELFTGTYNEFAAKYITDKNTAATDTNPKVNLNGEDQEMYSNIMSAIETYEEEQRAAFIKGTRSLDEFDAFVEELNAMGDIQAAMDLYNSKLN